MIRILLDFNIFLCYNYAKDENFNKNNCKEENIMKNKDKIGIIKGFDKLGRIVIPKELRERFSLSDNVEIVATTDGVLLKNPEYVLVKKEEK